MIIDDINKRISDLYGRDVVTGLPKFRIVWSEDHNEWRIKNDQMVLLKKYAYLKDRWVLERYMAGGHEDLRDTINYEPIWVFANKNGEYLEPNERAVLFLLHSLHNPEKLTPGQVRDADDKAFEKEVAYFYDYFDNESPLIAEKLKHGEAVTVGEVKCTQ